MCCYSWYWHFKNKERRNYILKQKEFEEHRCCLFGIICIIIGFALFISFIFMSNNYQMTSSPAEFKILSYEPESVVNHRITSKINVQATSDNFVCEIVLLKRYHNIQQMESEFMKNKTLVGYIIGYDFQGLKHYKCQLRSIIDDGLRLNWKRLFIIEIILFCMISCPCIEILIITYYILPTLVSKQKQKEEEIEEIQNLV